MDRRRFLKVFGIGGGAVVGGLVLPGVIAEKWGPEEPEIDDPRPPSFWEIDAGGFPQTPQLTSDLEMDAVVIGAGITGLSAVWTLKELAPSLKVCLIDSHRPCSGASSRNSAHLQGEYHSWRQICHKQGVERAREWNQFSHRGLESIFDFIRSHQIDCGLHRSPLFWTAREKQLKALEGLFEDMKRVGMPGKLLLGKEFYKVAGFKFYAGAIKYLNNWIMHPGKLMKGFLEVVQKQGIPVYSRSPVLKVINTDSSQETNILKTPKGTIACKKVLFATNAYTPRLGGLLSYRMFPVVLATLVTEPFSSSDWKAWDYSWEHISEYQFVNRTIGHTPDRRIYFRGIFGYSSFNSCVWKNLEGGFRRLEREFQERIPWARDLKLAHRWTGAVGITYSQSPIAGALGKKGQYVAVGYNGFGMVQGFYHGRLVAHLMLGESHPDLKYLKGPWGWIPPEPYRTIGTKTFFFFALKD